MDSKILIVVAIIAGIVIVSYIIQEKPQGNFEFEYKECNACDASGDEIINHIRNHIKNITWENNVLIIEAVVLPTTCGNPDFKLFGDYKVDGNNISLTVSETTSFFFHSKCAGYCNVKFKIKHLKKQNYNILLFTVMAHRKALVDEKLFINDTLYSY